MIAHITGDGVFEVPIKWVPKEVQHQSTRSFLWYRKFNLKESKSQYHIEELFFDFFLNEPNSIFKEIEQVELTNYS